METTVVTSSEWSSLLSLLTSQFSSATIVEVLLVVAGASIGLVFTWWGVRKLASVLMSAFRKGKISL